MAKTKISEYDSTAGNNTDINSINIDEGCSPSGINNAIRALMSHLKNWQGGLSGDSLPIASGGTGAVTAGAARTALGAASTGSNSDITALTALTTALTLMQGGTGGSKSSVANVARTSNVATITTSSTHGYTTGDKITISGVTTTGFNAANVTIASTPSTTTFTYSNTGSDVSTTTDTTGVVISLTSIRSNLGMVFGTDIPAVNTATTFTKQQNTSNVTLTDGTNIDWDLSLAQVATVTLGGTRTFNAPTNMVNGGFYALAVYQDGTGGRTLTWNSVFKWNVGTAPTLSGSAGAKDFFVFRSDGTNLYEQGRSQGVA
jgi:hypothetical protein